ncbi:MAG: hypothetical protein QMD23_03800 [Candidatus Bathyarchaeia archaeon]|nr:hypothetical protein [Candidatus Bathyarchaeia archaeon]
MFNFNYEKEIRELIRKFGLTRREAEGLLRKSEDWSEIKKFLNIKNLSFILILVAIVFGIFTIGRLFNELIKNERLSRILEVKR